MCIIKGVRKIDKKMIRDLIYQKKIKLNNFVVLETFKTVLISGLIGFFWVVFMLKLIFTLY